MNQGHERTYGVVSECRGVPGLPRRGGEIEVVHCGLSIFDWRVDKRLAHKSKRKMETPRRLHCGSDASRVPCSRLREHGVPWPSRIPGPAHEAVSMAPKSLAQHHLRFISWSRGGDQRGVSKDSEKQESLTRSSGSGYNLAFAATRFEQARGQGRRCWIPATTACRTRSYVSGMQRPRRTRVARPSAG